MADPLPWPSALLVSSEDWSLRGGTRSGGQTFLGNEQIVASPTARWKATLTIPCMRPDAVRAMRQVIALGRTQVWIIGPYEYARAPWNIDFIGGPVTYKQGAKDAAIDPNFEADAITSSKLDFRVISPAALNATSMDVQRNRGGALAPGMIFSINGRLHVITSLDGETATPGQIAQPGAMTVNFRPWLRAPATQDDAIEFGAPFGPMRLASDDTGAMELQLSRTGSVSVELVEAF